MASIKVVPGSTPTVDNNIKIVTKTVGVMTTRLLIMEGEPAL